MWFRRVRAKVDPFASGYILMDYEKRDPLGRAAQEIEQPAEDVRRGGFSATLMRKPSPPKRGADDRSGLVRTG